MLNLFLYLLITVCTCYIAVLHESTVVTALFILLLFIPVPSLLLARYLSRGITLSFSAATAVAEQGQALPLVIQVHNSRFLPVSHLSVDLNCRHSYLPLRYLGNVAIAVNAKDTTRLEYQMQAETCGQVSLSLSHVRVYDYFHLCYFSLSCSQSFVITVLPRIYPVSIAVERTTAYFAVESDTYDSHSEGDDPAEIFRIHTYRPGDTMQRIHWKLSAKSDEIMIKEFGRPLGCAVVLIVDWHPHQAQVTEDSYSCLLELIFSISDSLIKALCPHYLAWYSPKKEDILRLRISESEDLYEIAELLFSAEVNDREQDLFWLYDQKYHLESYCTGLLADLSLRLFKNGKLVRTFRPSALEEELHSQTILV